MLTFLLLTMVLVLNSFESTYYVAWSISALWIGWIMLRRGTPIAFPRQLIQLCTIPLLLLLVALPGALFHPFRDVARDFWLFINPITYIALGYLLFERIKSWSELLQPFIVIGLVASVYALWNAYTHRFLLLSSTVEGYRQAAGYGFAQAMVPIILILLSRRFRLASGYLDRQRVTRVLLYVIGGIAVVLSLSRTILFVLFAGLLLAIPFRRLRQNLVQGKPSAILLAFAMLAALILTATGPSFFAPEERQTGSFMDKIANIPQEVRIHHFDTYDDINADWRGFEAYRALVTYQRFSSREAIMGGGLGALVDLGFAMPLSPVESLQFVPTTHNGYAFLLIKTGPLGLLLFLIMIYLIARHGWKSARSHDPHRMFVGYLLLWTSLTLLMTQAVVNGFYNRNGLSPNLLLLGAAYAALRELNSGAKPLATASSDLNMPLLTRSA